MVKRIKRQPIQFEVTPLKIIVDEMTVAENQEKQAARAGKKRSLYASDYGQCMRKCWYQFFPEEHPQPEFSPRTLRIFQNGEDVHERLSRYLRRADFLEFEDEINIPRDELDVHGRCDGICIVDGDAVVTEFKSINRASVLEPKPEHVGQITWYMHMWKQHKDKLMEDRTYNDKYDLWLLKTNNLKGELIYESKQTQQTFHFPIEYSEAKAAEVRDWFVQLDTYVKTKTIPPVKYDGSKFPCRWGRGQTAGKCPYYDKCWVDEEQNID